MISFQNKLTNMINEQINNFLREISSSYTIPYEELVRIWENGKKKDNKEEIVEEKEEKVVEEKGLKRKIKVDICF